MSLLPALGAPCSFSARSWRHSSLPNLPDDTSGPFIRRVFPVYYLVLSAICGLAAEPVLFTARFGILECVLLLLVTLGLLYARHVGMPRINQLRDAATAGDATAQKQFERRHRSSVWLHAVQMIVVLVVHDLLTILAAGLVAGLLCKRFGVSLLLGYLLMGVLLGDGLLGWVSDDNHEIEYVADARRAWWCDVNGTCHRGGTCRGRLCRRSDL